MTDEVIVEAGGRLYTGWSAVSVERGVSRAASSFSVAVSRTHPDVGAVQAFRPGDPVVVSIGDPDGARERILTGSIDRPTSDLSSTDHPIGLEGRSRTKDLIDCWRIDPPYQIRGRLEDIAAELCRPFGIAVETRVSTGQDIPDFRMEQGDKVWPAIEELCRLRTVFGRDTPAGDLALDRPGRRGADGALILYGTGGADDRRNTIKSAAFDSDEGERFSPVVVRAQGVRSADNFGRNANEVTAQALDPGVGRYRPRLVRPDRQMTTAQAQAYADWEVARAFGLSQTLTVVVDGWRQPGGALWDAGLTIPVDIDALNVRGDWVSESVDWSVDDAGGSITTLTLRRPEAFEPAPPGGLSPQANETQGGAWAAVFEG
ncbi:MAG: phage baseplate assembly protein [Pseudomonadota bacterium]